MSFPKVALGTWLMGGTKDPDPNNDDAKDIEVIQTALDFGIELIDTAQNYAAGRCEELVGEAISKYPRDSFKILTKQQKSALKYDEVIQGCHDSMKRLGIDYIDYFVCHAPNLDVDMRDFFKAANQLHKDGLIKHVGVSNFGPKMLDIAVETSDPPIALNQVSFSLGDDSILRTKTYDYCVKNKIPIQAYRTLVDLDKFADIAKAIKTIAAERNVTKQQVALAYLNSYKEVSFTIRASSPAHWQEIKDALKIKLSEKEVESLKKVHKNKKGLFEDFLHL